MDSPESQEGREERGCEGHAWWPTLVWTARLSVTPAHCGLGAQPSSSSRQRQGCERMVPQFSPDVPFSLLFLPGPTQINQVVSHPNQPLTITAHDDRGIRFLDNRTGEALPAPPLTVLMGSRGGPGSDTRPLVSTLEALSIPSSPHLPRQGVEWDSNLRPSALREMCALHGCPPGCRHLPGCGPQWRVLDVGK